MSIKRRGRECVVPAEMKQIVGMFYMFINYYEAGLLCFFSEAKLPDREILSEIVAAGAAAGKDAGRVDCSQQIPQAQGMLEKSEAIECLIDKFGGLDMFRQSFDFFAKMETEKALAQGGYINRFKLIQDISSVGCSRYPSIGSVALRYHISTQNMWAKVKKALEQIAKDIYWKQFNRTKEKAAC